MANNSDGSIVNVIQADPSDVVADGFSLVECPSTVDASGSWTWDSVSFVFSEPASILAGEGA